MTPETLLLLTLLGLGILAALALLWFVLENRYTQKLNLEKQKLRSELHAEMQGQHEALKQVKKEILEKQKSVAHQAEVLLQKTEAFRVEQEQARHTLAHLTPETARKEVLDEWQQELKENIQSRLKSWQEYLEAEKTNLSQEILTRSIESLSLPFVQEGSICRVPLPHKNWRGKLLGREGRNVQSLQNCTGVDFILEESPAQAILSCFDPFRRELAKKTLEQLFQTSGRVHPELIERIVLEQEKGLKDNLLQLGKQAAESCGIEHLHSDILRTLGSLNYRTSYGQNVLKHAQEVSELAAELAERLGGDIQTARRAGLLHDLGKAIKTQESASHTELGVDLARRCGESPEVLHAMAAHHNEVKPQSLEALLVQIADRLSAARPGARHQPQEKYVQRLEEMEQLALEFPGVRQAIILKSGREIRVLVDPDQVSETDISLLAFKLARKIETQLELPGQVRVNVFREIQASDFAR